MRPGGGKAKGSGFEGNVANKLSAALAPLKFIRTQGSGARVGGKNFETLGKMFGEEALKLFVGDVVPVNQKEAGVTFLHSIECKSYKTPDNFTALVASTANVFKWMKEAEEDAVKTGLNPLLIFKWNNTPIFVAMSSQRCHPVRLTLMQQGKMIYIAYLDDLLKYPRFWYDVPVHPLSFSSDLDLLSFSSGISNESQESKSISGPSEGTNQEGSPQG